MRFISRKIFVQDGRVKAQQPAMQRTAGTRVHLCTTSGIHFVPSAPYPPTFSRETWFCRICAHMVTGLFFLKIWEKIA